MLILKQIPQLETYENAEQYAAMEFSIQEEPHQIMKFVTKI